MHLGTSEDPSSTQAAGNSRSFSNGNNGSTTSTPVKSSNTGLTNGSSGKSESNGVANGQAVTRPTGPFFGHDREEVTRILIQSLTDLGYHGAAGVLSRESGYELENPSVAAFRNAIQSGEWAEAEALLFGSRQEDGGGGVALRGGEYSDDAPEWLKRGRMEMSNTPSGLPLSETANKKEMLFMIRQQKYLELLEERELGSALLVLRQELTPLHQDTGRLHALSSLIMCPSAQELRNQSQWDGALGDSRSQLLSELSRSIAPSVMIPEHRLAVLLDQVQQGQVEQCLYHNTTTPPSLYYDHACERDGFPLHLTTELREHSDEVWYIEFSHNGSMLASASSDNSIIIWDTRRWKMIMRLSENSAMPDVQGICYVAWSPDDRYLLSCSKGNDLTVYDIKEGGRNVISIVDFEYTVTSAAWSPDGQSFVVGSHDTKRSLSVYSLSTSKPLYSFSQPSESLRVTDVSISRDGSRLAAVTHNDQRILIYDFNSRTRIADWAMEEKLTCVNLSHDGKTVLVSMNNSKLVLFEVATGEVVQHYPGLKQREFIIRSNFGGAGEGFVVSGSEDSHIYIWRRQSGILVAGLEAHEPGAVNCVAWHPTNPAIFASAGDDKRVRIWSNHDTIRALSSSSGFGRVYTQ